MMRLLVLLLIIQSHLVDSGALERWRGRFPAIFNKPVAPLPPPTPSFFQRFTNGISNAAAGLFQAVGSFLPLRGIASLAADIGIPGAATLLHFLTPRSALPRIAASSRPINHRSTLGRSNAQAPKGFSPFRAEIQSIVGAAHGEQDCVLKLACLSGKRLSALSGASAMAIMLAVATDMMPHQLRDPYIAMKNSVMYSDDCSQYVCARNREDL